MALNRARAEDAHDVERDRGEPFDDSLRPRVLREALLQVGHEREVVGDRLHVLPDRMHVELVDESGGPERGAVESEDPCCEQKAVMVLMCSS